MYIYIYMFMYEACAVYWERTGGGVCALVFCCAWEIYWLCTIIITRV